MMCYININLYVHNEDEVGTQVEMIVEMQKEEEEEEEEVDHDVIMVEYQDMIVEM